MSLLAGETLRRFSPDQNLIFDASGNIVGIQNRNANGADLRANVFVDSTGQATSNGVVVGMPSFTPQRFGAVGDNVADDTVALQAFFDYCAANRVLGTASPKDTFKFTAPLTITLPAFYELNRARFFPSASMTTGYAVQINGAMGISSFNAACKLNGFALIGPTGLSGTLDGISFGGTGQTVANVVLRDLLVYGFRDAVKYGDNTYLIKLYDFVITKCTRYGERYDCTVNAGENISHFGGAIGNIVNANAGRCVYSTTENPFLSVSYHGVSFDYSDCNFDINAGTFDFYNCHQENGNQLPMGLLLYTSGKPHPVVRWKGGDIAFGAGGFNRATLFDVDGACTFEADGVTLSNSDSGTSTSLVVTHGTPWKIVSKFIYIPGTAGASIPCTQNNQLFNYDFAASIANAWTSSLQAGSAIDATTTYTLGGRTYSSFKFVLHATLAQNIQQKISVAAAGNHLFLAAIRADTLTTGSASVSVSYYAADGTTLISTVTAGVAVTTSQAFTPNGTALRIPQGAAFAVISLAVTAGSGTVYFSLPGAWAS